MTGGQKLWLVGLSHHSAPVDLREKLAFDNGTLPTALARLRSVAGVTEGALVSTCNRVEVVAVSERDLPAAQTIAEFLRGEGRLAGDLEPYLYVREDQDAVRHLFRVAASLDSMVVGEPQILGQVKDFYRVAVENDTVGLVLHRAFQKSFSVAKRIRTETGIGSSRVSVSSVAVDLAMQIFETLEEKTAMVIGAGKMSELTARHLQANGTGAMMFANRTFDRAVELARTFRGTPVPFEDLERYLPLADVVIGSTGGTGFLLSPEDVQRVLRERKNRPMFLIDLSVPRSFDPRINEVDGVYLYDIDDLEGVLAGNREEREEEARRAEAILDEEVAAFWTWFQGLEVTPTIARLRSRLDEIRRREIERTLGALPALGAEERKALETMTEAIVKKFLHRPIARLKRKDPKVADDLEAARRLFGLDEDED